MDKLRIYQEKTLRKLRRFRKNLLFSFLKSNKNTVPMFIMGYGRSGTSILLNILDHDSRIEALGENDHKIAKNYMLLYEKLNPVTKNSKAQVLVMKPILNSFDAYRILEEYNNAKIIWMVRDYKDVIASAIKKFGPTVANYMKNYVLYNKGNNWISSGLPDDTLKILKNLEKTDFTIYDWMAIVWWSINRTILLNNLLLKNRFLLVYYENLVTNPKEALNQIYNFIGIPYKFKFEKYIYRSSIGKGINIHLNPATEAMCNNLITEINKLYYFKVTK